jgi:membrane protein implicated in regulation of membrane protease activity
MPNSADAWRRWFGLFFLAVAFAMLVWGQTVLRGTLKGIPYLLYWMVCFLFTFAAIITAVLDMRATRRRARREHEELLRRTFDDIDRDAR